MSYIFRNYLFIQIAVIFAVGSIFALEPNKLVAGAMAGGLFVCLGASILFVGLTREKFRKTPTFMVGLVHLFGTSLPMVITRFLNVSLGFEEVRILGLPGPVFHQVSTGVYTAMMVATAFDWYRSRRIERAA